MIVMCQFDKGIFTPAVNGEGAFAEVRHMAFEGSDYQEELYREGYEDSIPLSGTPTSLMGGYGFTGENKASSSLGEQASDTLSDLMDNSWFLGFIAFVIFILYMLFKGNGWGGGSSSGGYSGGSRGSSSRSASNRSSGWGGSSSSRGGGGHSGGGGSGFR